MQSARLNLSRTQILAYRRHVGGLESRAKIGKRSIRRVAWAGLAVLGLLQTALFGLRYTPW